MLHTMYFVSELHQRNEVKVEKPGKVTPIRQPKTAPVTDLLKALQQTLQANAKTTKASSPAKKTNRKKSARVA